MDKKPMYDGIPIVRIVEVDEGDDYQPFLFELEDGQTVWIPIDVEEYPTELANAWKLSGQIVGLLRR